MMETIKVNMTPCEDVQTIHASQNDGEARQWGFELHNNGDVIDSSEVTDQITFKAYKGGTEEILPSALYNGSVDLGSLTWDYISEIPIYQATITDGRFVRGQDLPCDMYSNSGTMSSANMPNMTYQILNNGTLWIKNTSYSSADSFKTAMQGVYLWYQKTDSTPSTSPFDGTIKYPSGSVDSYFTYRQSPTEKDGLAKIADIKGNTSVWNQLVRNGNFVDTSYWNGNGAKTVSNNELTYTKPARWNSLSNSQLINLVSGHKYLAMFEAYCENDTMSIFWQTGIGTGEAVYTIPSGTSWKKYSLILTSAQTTASGRVLGFDNNSAQETIFHLRNYMFIDLTMMGLDSMTLDEVKEWLNAYYPLPYYDYNTGTLLSFNGNGIKTTGTNQFNSEHAISATNVVESNDNGTITIKDVSSATWSNAYIGYSDVIAGKEYTFKASLKYGRIGGNLSGTSRPASANQPDTNIGDLIFVAVTSAIPSRTFIPNFTGRIYWWYCTDIQNANHQQFTMQPMLSTTDADFEAYTSSIADLPISQYFPNGMKSAGNVYDEWTPSKATTRVRQLILDGTQTPRLTGITVNQVFSFDNLLASAPCKTVNTNITSIYGIGASYSTIAYDTPKVAFSTPTTPLLIFPSGRFSNVSELLTYLQSKPVPINYELATSTEISFTTASLVTENAEIPLSNEDGVLIGKCTEELSAQPGFFDAKIRLADEDGDIYSNKIQLHVERKP